LWGKYTIQENLLQIFIIYVINSSIIFYFINIFLFQIFYDHILLYKYKINTITFLATIGVEERDLAANKPAFGITDFVSNEVVGLRANIFESILNIYY